MKYKVGDRVRIKDDLSRCMAGKQAWAGKVMTIRAIGKLGLYLMKEDMNNGNDWYWWGEKDIAGLEEEEMDNYAEMSEREIEIKAIEVYGREEQIRMIGEECGELIAALNKNTRFPNEATRQHVVEEIADVQIMAEQAALMFGREEVRHQKNIKLNRLAKRLERDEDNLKKIQVVYGQHRVNGKEYAWINPDEATVKVGEIVIADTAQGHKPILITKINWEPYIYVKDHRKIIAGGLNNL